MPTILSTLVTLPPATRFLTLTLFTLSTLYFLLRLSLPEQDFKTVLGPSGDAALAFPWLLLVPGKVLWNPWTLLTAGFVETNLIEVRRFSSSCCFSAGWWCRWRSEEEPAVERRKDFTA